MHLAWLLLLSGVACLTHPMCLTGLKQIRDVFTKWREIKQGKKGPEPCYMRNNVVMLSNSVEDKPILQNQIKGAETSTTAILLNKLFPSLLKWTTPKKTRKNDYGETTLRDEALVTDFLESANKEIKPKEVEQYKTSPVALSSVQHIRSGQHSSFIKKPSESRKESPGINQILGISMLNKSHKLHDEELGPWVRAQQWIYNLTRFLPFGNRDYFYSTSEPGNHRFVRSTNESYNLTKLSQYSENDEHLNEIPGDELQMADKGSFERKILHGDVEMMTEKTDLATNNSEATDEEYRRFLFRCKELNVYKVGIFGVFNLDIAKSCDKGKTVKKPQKVLKSKCIRRQSLAKFELSKRFGNKKFKFGVGIGGGQGGQEELCEEDEASLPGEVPEEVPDSGPGEIEGPPPEAEPEEVIEEEPEEEMPTEPENETTEPVAETTTEETTLATETTEEITTETPTESTMETTTEADDITSSTETSTESTEETTTEAEDTTTSTETHTESTEETTTEAEDTTTSTETPTESTEETTTEVEDTTTSTETHTESTEETTTEAKDTTTSTETPTESTEETTTEVEDTTTSTETPTESTEETTTEVEDTTTSTETPTESTEETTTEAEYTTTSTETPTESTEETTTEAEDTTTSTETPTESTEDTTEETATDSQEGSMDESMTWSNDVVNESITGETIEHPEEGPEETTEEETELSTAEPTTDGIEESSEETTEEETESSTAELTTDESVEDTTVNDVSVTEEESGTEMDEGITYLNDEVNEAVSGVEVKTTEEDETSATEESTNESVQETGEEETSSTSEQGSNVTAEESITASIDETIESVTGVLAGTTEESTTGTPTEVDDSDTFPLTEAVPDDSVESSTTEEVPSTEGETEDVSTTEEETDDVSTTEAETDDASTTEEEIEEASTTEEESGEFSSTTTAPDDSADLTTEPPHRVISGNHKVSRDETDPEKVVGSSEFETIEEKEEIIADDYERIMEITNKRLNAPTHRFIKTKPYGFGPRF